MTPPGMHGDAETKIARVEFEPAERQPTVRKLGRRLNLNHPGDLRAHFAGAETFRRGLARASACLSLCVPTLSGIVRLRWMVFTATHGSPEKCATEESSVEEGTDADDRSAFRREEIRE